MPYDRPTLSQIRARVGAAYRGRFPGADTNLRHSPDRALVEVVAGSTDEDLAYLDWQVRQLFPFSSDLDYLQRWSAAKKVAQKEATAGAGTVTLTGEPDWTAVAGTQLQSDDGVVVALTAAATVGEDRTVTVAAASVAGGAGSNLGSGVRLTFIGTPPGFSDTAVVASPFAGGAEAESVSSLRLRTLRAFAEPSFGGNRNDWERAVLAVVGVTRVFSVAATPTPGAVTLFPLFDALRENGIPDGVDAYYRPTTGIGAGDGDQLAVLEAIIGSRPICASVFVTALVPSPVDVQIAGLSPDTPAIRDAIAAEIARMLFRRATPGLTVSRSWINEAVSRATGEDQHDLVAPAGNVAIASGHIAVLGEVTYV